MGSSLCSSNNSSISIPKPTKTPKPTKIFTSQKSNFQSRALHSTKKRQKMIIGKTLSFQKISIIKLLQVQEIHNKHLSQSVARMKKSLISTEISPVSPKELLENLSVFYPNIQKITIVKNEGNNILIEYEENTGKLQLIKRKTFGKIEAFSNYLIHLQNISKLNIPGIEKYKEIRLHNLNNQYIADIFKEKKGENLLSFFEKIPNSSKNYLQILEIIKKISIILHQLHRRNIAFKTLKHTSILIENPDDYIVTLAIGGGHTSILENLFVDFYVKNQEDYQSYDIISLGFVFLTLFSKKILMEDLYKTRNNNDITKIFEEKGQEIPKIMVDFMKKMLDLERKNHYTLAIQLISELESLILKGIQNDLKQDFLSEVFLNKITKQNSSEFLYFHQKNKIFIYNEEKKITCILKVFLGKRKWNIRSYFLQYSKHLKGFITLVSPFTAKIARIPFNEETLQTNNQKIAEIKTNIEFLYEIKDNTIKSPELLVQNENFYLISNKIYQVSAIKIENSVMKFQEKCIENSEISSDSYHYSFFDSKLENLFILFETPNFFKNGITILSRNMKTSTNFSKTLLKFHLNNAEMIKSFYSLDISLNFIYFYIEISENIFLINASKILLILDLFSGNFYSFSSLFQLQNYEYSKKTHPMSFSHTFETRNLPFELDFSCGKLSFEDRILKFFCKKDQEILLCKFILIPNQSCISLINCTDLSKNENFMIFSPKEIKLDWSLVKKNKEICEESIKKIGDYEILSVIYEENNAIDYKARKNNEFFCLKPIEIASLEEFELLMKNFNFILENSYLIETKELFLYQENDKLFAIIVREHFESTLLQEFLHRKSKNRFYSSKNLAFLIKCVFEGLIFLYKNAIIHGNLELNNIVFTDKGYLKIKGWYLENKPNFSSFIIDAGLMLLDCAKLEFIYEFNENIVEISKEFLDINYPGLSQFLLFLLKIDLKKIDIKSLQKEMEKAYFTLQYKDLDFSRYQTEKQKMFWINYGDNSLISADISSQKHHPLKVLDSQQQPYVFSTFNTFTYDLNENLYVTGNQKLSKSKSQDFFLLALSPSSSPISLQPLPPIPLNILNPTTLYIEKNKSIYLFGGYLSSENSHKTPSKQVLSYNIPHKSWTFKNPMPLALVSSTAVISKKGVYLFGGISEEIDLTGPELNFLQFDFETESWEFMVNFACLSPFENSRFLKPNIISLGEEVFLFFEKKCDKYLLEIFELQMGGFKLKFESFVEKDDKTSKRRLLQNEMSLCFNAGVLYNLEEKTKSLCIWDIKDFEKLKMRKIESKELEDEDEEFKDFENKALNN